MYTLVSSISLSIITTVEDFVQPYITQLLDLLQGQPVWLQGVAVLALGLFTIVGLIVFIKKFIKLFLVLAVLGAIGYFLWTQTDILQNLLGGLTGAYIGPNLLFYI
ncbi:MAG: hypothetical protein JXB20_05535 [Bacilli bacterium]|nr:hypothetical protein [Bacilli bacterium]